MLHHMQNYSILKSFQDREFRFPSICFDEIWFYPVKFFFSRDDSGWPCREKKVKREFEKVNAL